MSIFVKTGEEEVTKMTCGIPDKKSPQKIALFSAPLVEATGMITSKILQGLSFLTPICLPSFIQIDPVSKASR